MPSVKVATVVRRSLKQVKLDDCDQAAAILAVRYAELLDAGEEPAWRIGPRLLDVLRQLGMTPAARRSAVIALGGRKEVAANEPAVARSPLDELRRKRQQRAG